MILVLGGGLAGLATAHELARRLPGEPCLVLEADAEPGGLARSRAIDGFTFDLTGHYLHLREPETSALVRDLLGDALVEVERRSYIRTHGVRLDFPFQANLHGLPAEVVARCLVDFVEAGRQPAPGDPRMPFEAWARCTFGDGIAEEFLLPYNAKLFGVPPSAITAEWVAWSVPRPELAQVVRGALGLPNTALGYNPRFLYPDSGGIGRLPAALAARVADRVRTGARVVSIDAAARRVVLEGGETLGYDRLVSTLPLPYLLQRTRGLDRCPGHRAADGPPETFAELAGRLRWTATIDLELGIARAGVGEGAHWLYFPDPAVPFYRVGIPSNVCPALAPAGCSSLSVEFAHRPGEPLPSAHDLLERARPGLAEAGLLRPDDRVLVAERVLLDPSYVLFDPRRTATTETALARLRRAGILSIGRFGAWTYSYMERALIDGREAARSLAREDA